MSIEYRIFDAARRAVNLARERNLQLNDPHGDGSGRDAQAPTGDDYNLLLDAMGELADVLGIKLS